MLRYGLAVQMRDRGIGRDQHQVPCLAVQMLGAKRDLGHLQIITEEIGIGLQRDRKIVAPIAVQADKLVLQLLVVRHVASL